MALLVRQAKTALGEKLGQRLLTVAQRRRIGRSIVHADSTPKAKGMTGAPIVDPLDGSVIVTPLECDASPAQRRREPELGQSPNPLEEVEVRSGNARETRGRLPRG
jgi:hypothetical protein